MSTESNQSRLIANDARAIKCQCCELPSVEIQGGLLLVKNRHHGRTHENRFGLEWLTRQLEALREQQPTEHDAQ